MKYGCLNSDISKYGHLKKNNNKQKKNKQKTTTPFFIYKSTIANMKECSHR